MNLINNIIDELKISNCHFVPSVIEEINKFVIHKLLTVNEIYKNDFNKYHLLGNLVNLGYMLENILTPNNDILSLQLNFLSGLFKPIINKIRNVCLEINLELVNEYKNQISDLIMSDLNKYNVQKKNIKFIQVNCLCKNLNYYINKEIMFEDFGISIKITNQHFKDIFKNLIEETNLPIQNLPNNNSRDKKSDWNWRAIEYKNYCGINLNIDEQDFLDTNFIEQNNNYISVSNSDNLNDNVESFKIIQKIPESIQSSLTSNISNISNSSNSSNNTTFNQNINMLKSNEKQMSFLISNSIVIEDDSFSIPIDLDDNLTTLTNIDQ
jgi:hypothetical protein